MRKNYLIDSRHSYSIVSRLCELPNSLAYEWMTKYHELELNCAAKYKTLEGRRPVNLYRKWGI